MKGKVWLNHFHTVQIYLSILLISFIMLHFPFPKTNPTVSSLRSQMSRKLLRKNQIAVSKKSGGII